MIIIIVIITNKYNTTNNNAKTNDNNDNNDNNSNNDNNNNDNSNDNNLRPQPQTLSTLVFLICLSQSDICLNCLCCIRYFTHCMLVYII